MGDSSTLESIESLREWTENLTVVIFMLGTCTFVVFFIRLLKLVQEIVKFTVSSPDKGRLRSKSKKKTRSGKSKSKSRSRKKKKTESNRSKKKSKKKSKKVSKSKSSSSRKEDSSKKSEKTKKTAQQSINLEKVTVMSDSGIKLEKPIVHPSSAIPEQETAKGFTSLPITSATQASTVAPSTTSATKPLVNGESAKKEIENQKRQEQLKAMDDIKLIKRVEGANV